MARRQLDWRKGFKRLFLVVAIGWIAYVLWAIPTAQWDERFKLAEDSWTRCLSENAFDKSWVESCHQQRDKALGEIPHTAWSGLGWHGWLGLLSYATMPPLVAYCLFRAAGLVTRWIWRGFAR
jgi:hypothetical protein